MTDYLQVQDGHCKCAKQLFPIINQIKTKQGPNEKKWAYTNAKEMLVGFKIFS